LHSSHGDHVTTRAGHGGVATELSATSRSTPCSGAALQPLFEMATPAPAAPAVSTPGTAPPASASSDEPPLRGMVRSHLIAGVDQPVVRTAMFHFPASVVPHFFSLVAA
jgi:hypothetical protein